LYYPKSNCQVFYYCSIIFISIEVSYSYREKGEPVFNKLGQVLVKHGDEEVRRDPEPFPLYPGETLFGKVSPLQVVTQNTALRLRATRDIKIDDVFYNAGDEWLFRGYCFFLL
jgi:hypothetical protein